MPAYPAPMIRTSHSDGSSSVVRLSSRGCSSERQNGNVEFGTGSGLVVVA